MVLMKYVDFTIHFPRLSSSGGQDVVDRVVATLGPPEDCRAAGDGTYRKLTWYVHSDLFGSVREVIGSAPAAWVTRYLQDGTPHWELVLLYPRNVDLKRPGWGRTMKAGNVNEYAYSGVGTTEDPIVATLVPPPGKDPSGEG